MSTNANINVKIGERYYAVYLHWDGHPEHALATLKKNYNTLEKAAELILHGNISQIKENISAKKGVKHTYDAPVENVCVFYGRDRGEKDQAPRTLEAPAFEEEFAYLFENGAWTVLTR